VDFEPSDKVKRLVAQVRAFREREVYPAGAVSRRRMGEAYSAPARSVLEKSSPTKSSGQAFSLATA
jgi:hypothetical protein